MIYQLELVGHPEAADELSLLLLPPAFLLCDAAMAEPTGAPQSATGRLAVPVAPKSKLGVEVFSEEADVFSEEMPEDQPFVDCVMEPTGLGPLHI